MPCDVFITEATFGLPVFRHGEPAAEIDKLLRSVKVFPERAHLVGAYSLGKAQRVIAMLREAGYDKPIYLHGAMEKITRYYETRGIELGELELVRGADKAELAGAITLCPPSATQDVWTRRFPDPVAAFASGWMRVRARARQRGVELPLVISDHADWDGLTATIAATGASEIWVTHGQEDALVHWCDHAGSESAAARHRRLRRRGRERRRHRRQDRRSAMNRFAELLDRLAYEPGRNNKLRLIADYLRTTPDPERGCALAALTGALSFQHAKGGDDPRADRRAHRSGAVRAVLRLCRRPVRDRRADVAGRSGADARTRTPSLSEVIETLATLGKAQLPAQIARWLDGLDETGRWALLKLVTGGLRIGVSARLAKTAAASLGDKEPNEIEMLWPGLAPPYIELFAWLEGRAEKPPRAIRRRFRPAMLAHAIEETDFAALDPNEFMAEWKWDGIRVQAVAGMARMARSSRGFIRAPARTSRKAFPISPRRCACPAPSTANC